MEVSKLREIEKIINDKTVEQIDELKQMCISAVRQNAQMSEAINRENELMMIKRLEFLFRVVESKAWDGDFYNQCKDEIQSALVQQVQEYAPEEVSYNGARDTNMVLDEVECNQKTKK